MAAPYLDTATGSVVQLEPKDAAGNESRYFALHQTRPDQDMAVLWTPQSGYQTRVLADSPVAYWPLDDAAGSTTAKDAVGTRHGTLLGGVTFGAQGVGGTRAAQFDGVGSWIQILPPTTPPSPAFSWEAWVWPDLRPSFSAAVLSRHAADGANRVGGVAFACSTFGADKVGGSVTGGPGVTITHRPRTWQYLVITYHGPTWALLIYSNGVFLAQSQGQAGADDPASPFGMGIGGYYSTPGWAGFYQGRIQDVAIYNRVLTPAEIAAHYAQRS